MAMENGLFARYVVSLVDLVEHVCNIGMLRKVRVGKAECGLVKDTRDIPEDRHLVAINF